MACASFLLSKCSESLVCWAEIIHLLCSFSFRVGCMAHMSTKVQDSGLYSQKLLSDSCSVFKQLAGTMEVSELFPRKKKKKQRKTNLVQVGGRKAPRRCIGVEILFSFCLPLLSRIAKRRERKRSSRIQWKAEGSRWAHRWLSAAVHRTTCRFTAAWF